MPNVTSLQDTIKSVILKARKSAKRYDLNIRDQDLYKLARMVQEDKATHIRNISEYRAVFTTTYQDQELWFSYSTRYKLVDEFFSKREATLEVRDKVWFWEGERKVKGFVAISVPPYSSPEFEAFRQGGFDLSRLPPLRNLGRPQHSYVVAVEDDEVHYLYWPKLRFLRKGLTPEDVEKERKKTQRGRHGSSRNSLRGSGRTKSHSYR